MPRLHVISNRDCSPEDASAAIARELAAAIEGEARFGRHDRMLYATDASLYQVEPIGVVIPSSVDDALRAVQFCGSRGLAILPRGAGTSLAGQCVNRAVVIDFSVNCRGIGEVDVAERRVRVEPGVVLDELNEEIARRGHPLFFAPDVATSRHANIGGMIGNNSAGARSVVYGRTVEHVLGIEALVVDERGRVDRLLLDEGAALRDERVGRLTRRVVEVVQKSAKLIRDKFPKILRRVDGYNLDLVLDQIESPGDAMANVNLARLLCGSEGTLAVTLGAELNLEPLPVARSLAAAPFGSLREAIEAVGPVLSTQPSAVELLDDVVLDVARNNVQQRRRLDLLPKVDGEPTRFLLLIEHSAGRDRDELAERLKSLSEALPNVRIASFTEPAAIADVWALRKAAEPLLHALPGRRKPVTFVEDTAVDPSKLPDFVEEFRSIVQRHGTRAAFFAHASVGCLHIRPMLDLRDDDDAERLVRIAEDVTDLVKRYDGALSGEHGDGRARSPLLERLFGPELLRVFADIKQIFDPLNLLNPGNITSPGRVEDLMRRTRLRPGEDQRPPVLAPDVETYFSYEDQEGFQGAVDRCNGAGVCRKKQGGTMCPSYMATLDERHSTRGRGNALRLAITGQLTGAPSWDDPQTLRTLDLCLSCKACKAECPSNVDVARLKSEYLAQRNRAQGAPPLRERAMANVRAINKAGAVAPALANWMMRRRSVRFAMSRAMGLAPQRQAPPFSKSLRRRLRHDKWRVRRDGPRVALFADCFSAWSDSHVGLAAVDLLDRLGYRVELLDAGCCARPMISMGHLDHAVATADRTLGRLLPAAQDDEIEAVLVCEPSCLSAFKDDWLSLKLKTPMKVRHALAEKSLLVEDFIDRRWDQHPITPDTASFTGELAPALLHGHCHQKALWGDETSAAALRRALGDRLRVLDSGCCGLAGSFGYTANRYELSMRIGELTLAPAVRSAPEAVIVAPGASCRRQIADATGRAALHPVELLGSLMRLSERESS